MPRERPPTRARTLRKGLSGPVHTRTQAGAAGKTITSVTHRASNRPTAPPCVPSPDRAGGSHRLSAATARSRWSCRAARAGRCAGSRVYAASCHWQTGDAAPLLGGAASPRGTSTTALALRSGRRASASPLTLRASCLAAPASRQSALSTSNTPGRARRDAAAAASEGTGCSNIDPDGDALAMLKRCLASLASLIMAGNCPL